MKDCPVTPVKLSHKDPKKGVREILKDSDRKAKVLFEQYYDNMRTADSAEANNSKKKKH